MHPISPAILIEAQNLSGGALALLALIGSLLWLAGWRLHQFWVVFGVTLAAGTVGLSAGPTAGGPQVLILGVLLAIAEGLLAVELARGASFLTGGAAAWAAARAVFPQAQELWAVFLLGAILGVVLFRLWAMLATSLMGSLLVGHALLALLHRSQKLDTVNWAERNGTALLGGLMIGTLLGIIVQAKLAGPTTATPDESSPSTSEEPHDAPTTDSDRPTDLDPSGSTPLARNAGRPKRQAVA
jgi:hypothetical protein